MVRPERMSEQTLYIVDAHAHIYACYYAIKALASPSGEPTNAVYGFTSTLLALLRDRKPDKLVVIFDPPGKVFRHEIYPDYKATRQPMPADLPNQIRRIHQVLEVMGISELVVPGFEADDVIATLARKASAAGWQVRICSKDKDLEQLIDERTRLYDCRTGAECDAARLLAEKGYRPDQALDIQTLIGDSIDNVPGVPGVGPKTAAKLLAEFGTLEALLAGLDKVKPALAAKIRENQPALELSRKLVRLRDDVPLPVELEAMGVGRPDPARMAPLFGELGFARFLDQLVSSEQQSAGHQVRGLTTAEDCDYRCIDTPDKLAAFAADLAKQTEFAFDTETNSLDSLHCELVGMSFAWQDRIAYYVPVQSPRGGGFGLPLAEVVRALGPALADPKIAKIGHHMKFDFESAGAGGMPVANLAFDTMIAAYLLDPEGEHGLDRLADAELGHKTIPISDLIGKGRDQINMRDVPLERIAPYAAEDADVTWRLYGKLKPRLAQSALDRLLADVEMPLVAVLAEMERLGVSLDVPLLEAMSLQMAGQAEALTQKIHAAAGGEFNIDSTRQLADVLFNTLGLSGTKKTAGGSHSTDSEVLETLAAHHEVPRLVLEYRQLVKLKGTYVDALPRMICAQTGRVHPTFTQTRTATGRLACQDPNLQNIPIRTPAGRAIRQAFIPGQPDWVMLTADYSQIELRMLAHFSEDPALMRAFAEDQDIHTFVAAQVFDVMPAFVDPEQRRRAKAVNFGIIYGQTPFGLSKSLGISQVEAKNFIDAYFRRYATIQRFIDRCHADARATGYVTTILGRRRPIPDINSSNKMQKALAERTAVNTVTQGSSADLIKLAMINIGRRIRTEGRPSRMLIQVHDELVFEMPREAVEAETEMIRAEMTGAIPLKVPLKVDIAWGRSWLEAK